MKTLTYLPTLLALTIQVMVSGQTQGNQARVVRIDIMGPKQPIKMNYSNSNITISVSEYNQLLEQANALKINAKSLRTEASEMEIRFLNKQIEASEFLGKISLQQFDQNRDMILELFAVVPKNKVSYSKAQFSNIEAERFIKLAKEMREEARAQLSPQAIYGELTNAEENEVLAISKQQEVIKLLQNETKSVPIQKTFLVNHIEKTNTNPSFNNISTVDSLPQSVSSHQVSKTSITEALFQLQEMQNTIQQIQSAAIMASEKQKLILLNEAALLENDVLFKKLEISNLNSKTDYQTFMNNRNKIKELLGNIKENTAMANRAIDLNNEAEYLMKIGKEQREEANAQLTLAAKVGAMSNAQETETLALNKQQDVIQVIDNQSSRTILASR